MGSIFISLEPEPEGFADSVGGVRTANRLGDNTGDRPLWGT